MHLTLLSLLILLITATCHAALSSRTQLDWWATDICLAYYIAPSFAKDKIFCISSRDFVVCNGGDVPQIAARVADGQTCIINEASVSDYVGPIAATYDTLSPRPFYRDLWPDQNGICQPNPLDGDGTEHPQDGCKKWWDQVKDGELQGHWS